MNRYSLAIFDMDGTILDTLEDLFSGVNFALKQNGFPIRTIDEVRQFVGNGAARLVEQAVSSGTSKEVQIKVLEDFHKYYREHSKDKTRPYDGIMELLHTLQEREIATAVVSNKPDYAVKQLAADYFPQLFSVAIGEKESEGIRKKPAPDSINMVLEKMGIPKEQSVYIGDSEVDIMTAKNASMDCIAVTWGFRDRAFLIEEGAAVLADSTEELLQFIIEE